MNCLVSGATGFIGRELCRQLAASGASLVPLSRRGAALPDGRPTIALDLAAGDIDAGLFDGVDVVFHLAGIAHQGADPAAHEAVNYGATLAMAEAAAAAGASCFIYLSSVKAMGPPATDEVRSEEECLPAQDAYGRSKRRAELALREAHAGTAMSVIILRPALVYGATPVGNLRSLAAAVRAGLPRPPALGGRSMISRTDLVALLIELAEEAPPGLNTWIVCDGQAYSACQIHDLMRLALGRTPMRSWVPLWFWRLGFALWDLASRAERGSSFDKVLGCELYSSSALEQAVGWRARHAFADSVREMMQSGSGRRA